MWPTELVQCIEYGSDGYFTWIFPFLFTCTSLPHSSVFCLLVQVAYIKPSKECSLFRLLEWSASSVSILKLLSTYWAMTGKRMGLSISWGRSHMALFCVRILPLSQLPNLTNNKTLRNDQRMTHSTSIKHNYQTFKYK